MSRIARVVATGVPHHITQRGVGQHIVFPHDAARNTYLSLLRHHAEQHRLKILAYCLMTNHVHVVAVPETPVALASTFRYTHGRYAHYSNAISCRNGHFWQSRFYSCPVEDAALDKVIAYVELNPVRAGMVRSPEDYPWSSARIHLGLQSDRLGLLDLNSWNQRWTKRQWRAALKQACPEGEAIRKATFTGRPLGSSSFTHALEQRLGRRLEPLKGGRPKGSVYINAMTPAGMHSENLVNVLTVPGLA